MCRKHGSKIRFLVMISMTPHEMPNFVYEWVDFKRYFLNLNQNHGWSLRKFGTNWVILVKISPKSGWLVYEWVTFLWKLVYVLVYFQIPSSTFLWNHTWVPPWICWLSNHITLTVFKKTYSVTPTVILHITFVTRFTIVTFLPELSCKCKTLQSGPPGVTIGQYFQGPFGPLVLTFCGTYW